jgi:hypothetical protein
MKEQLQQMNDIEESMCGGNISVTYSIVPGVGLPAFTDSTPFGDGESLLASHIALTIHEGVSKLDSQIDGHPLSSWEELMSVVQYGIEKIGLGDYACMDRFGSAGEFLDGTARLLFNASATTCADLAPFCEGGTSGALIRFLCPTTCGCVLPTSGLISRTEDMGCPVAFCKANVQYFSFIHEETCEDLNSTTLTHRQNSATLGWNRYFDNVLHHKESRKWIESAATLHESFLALGNFGPLNDLSQYVESVRGKGCGFLLDLRYMPVPSLQNTSFTTYFFLCHGNRDFAGLRAFCPESCLCHIGLGDCPFSCGALPQNSNA